MAREGAVRAVVCAVWSRVRALFARRRLDADFSRELDAHFDLLTDEYERRGLGRE